MPRSPTGSTSGRCSRNIRNISAVQRPNPFTAVSRSMTSSSPSLSSSRDSGGRRRCGRTDRADSPPSGRSARRLAALPRRAPQPPPSPDNVLREQRDEAAEDGRRGLGGQLLADDRADQRREMILALSLREAARTDALDGRAKHRVAPHQQSTGARTYSSGDSERGTIDRAYLIATVSDDLRAHLDGPRLHGRRRPRRPPCSWRASPSASPWVRALTCIVDAKHAIDGPAGAGGKRVRASCGRRSPPVAGPPARRPAGLHVEADAGNGGGARLDHDVENLTGALDLIQTNLESVSREVFSRRPAAVGEVEFLLDAVAGGADRILVNPGSPPRAAAPPPSPRRSAVAHREGCAHASRPTR